MKINSNSIRPGNFIKHKGEIYLSLKTQHTQPGKGGAYIQTELRNIRNGIKINERFRSNQSVEKIIINKKTAQFLFNNKEKYIFMDNENFEQISIPKALIGKKNIYLQNNTNVTINIYKENIISINIPESITIQIKSTPPVIKGQTVTSSYKPAILNNNIQIMVPQHISTGDYIVISTNNNSYLEKLKS